MYADIGKNGIYTSEKPNKRTVDVLNSFLHKVILIVLQNYELTKVSSKGFYVGNRVLIELEKFTYWGIISSRK